MATKVSKVASPKEMVIPSANTVTAGQMYVNGDTNGVFVASATHAASAEAGVQGISSNIKAIDLPARLSAFPDTGLPVFEVT